MKNVRKMVTLTTAVGMLTVNTFSTAVYAEGVTDGGDIAQSDTTNLNTTYTSDSGNEELSSSGNSETTTVTENNTPEVSETTSSDGPYLSPDTLPENPPTTTLFSTTPDEATDKQDTTERINESDNETSDVPKENDDSSPKGYVLEEGTLTITSNEGLNNWKKGLETGTINGDPIVETYPQITSIVIKEGVTSIGADSFKGCINLTTINFDAATNLEKIENSAFSYCFRVFVREDPDDPNSDFVISNTTFDVDLTNCKNLTTIEESAFHGCSNLSKIILPSENVLEEIGDSAFSYCQSLTDINLSECPNLTTLGKNAFANCTKLTSISLPDKVTTIGFGAFKNCTNLGAGEPGGKIDLGKCTNLTALGSEAFSGCSSLTGIVLPNNLQAIGTSTFSGCENLSSIDLPNNLQTIGASAFSGCGALKNIKLPSNIFLIKEYAFADTGLQSINDISMDGVDNLEEALKSVRIDMGAFPNKEGFPKPNRIPDGKYAGAEGEEIITGNYTLPEGIIYIGDKAFAGNTKLTGITFQEGTTTISSNAFSGCTELETITLPTSVKTIEHDAFKGCNSLTTIDLSGCPNLTTLGTSAFSGCGNLEKVILPSNLQYIKEGAFDTLDSIQMVKIDVTESLNSETLKKAGLTITQLKNLQKDGCIKLNGEELDRIKLRGKGLTNQQIDILVGAIDEARKKKLGAMIIEMDAFKYTANSDFPKPNKIPDGKFAGGFDNGTAGFENGTYTIPDGILYIGNNAFAGNDELKKIDFNEKAILRELGDSTFKGCTNLTNVNLPKGLETIGSSAFEGCTSLSFLATQGSINYIKEYAFKDCTNLNIDKLQLKDGVIIEMDAFDQSMIEKNKNLQANKIPDGKFAGGFSNGTTGFENGTYTIPDGILYIGNNAFAGNAELEKIVFKEKATLRELGDSAFKGCTSLTTVTLPTGLEMIGSSAFEGCTSLNSLATQGSINYIKEYAFKNCTSLNIDKLQLKDGAIIEMDAFDQSIIEKYPKLQANKIPDGKFAGSFGNGTTGFENGTYTIPNGILYIGNNAFAKNDSLKSIVFHKKLKELGDSAFSGCNSLTSVNLSECSELTALGRYAFNNCDSLKEVILPNSLKSIGAYAFSNTKLENIIIPSDVANIESRAFSDCPSLKEVRFQGTTPPEWGGGWPFGPSEDRKDLKILIPYDSWGTTNRAGKTYDEILGAFNLWYIPKVTLESPKWPTGGQVFFNTFVRWHSGVTSYQYQWMKSDGKGGWIPVGDPSANSAFQIRFVTEADYGDYCCFVTATMEGNKKETIMSDYISLNKESIEENPGGLKPPTKPNKPGSSNGNGNSGDSSQGSGDSSQDNGNSGDSSQGNGNSGDSSQGNGNSGDSQGNGNSGDPSLGNGNSGDPTQDGVDASSQKDGKTDSSSQKDKKNERDSLNDSSQDNNGSSSGNGNDESQLSADADAQTKGFNLFGNGSDIFKNGFNLSLLISLAAICIARILIIFIRKRKKEDE